MTRIEITERIKKIGNSYYINIRKDIMELLNLQEKDYLRITLEKLKLEQEE